MSAFKTIDEYIAQYPEPIQEICRKIRQTIRDAAPDAKEKISYGIPTFYDGENLIHFGVAKNHIGLYPSSSGIVAFAERLREYKTSRGTVQLPLSKPIPYALIRDMTLFRAREAAQRKNSPRG